MNSKWLAALISFAVLVAVGGTWSLAQDEEKKGDTKKADTKEGHDDEELDLETLHGQMTKVGQLNNGIRKNVRNEVNYRKSKEDANKAAKEILELAKKAKEFKEPAEKQKKEYKEYTDLMDKFIAASEKLVKETEEADSKQKAAKKSFDDMNITCTNCHNVFRVDEEDPFKE